MSLFLPSNLSPNFEEVVPNHVNSRERDNFDGVDIDFEFQVNTNGSLVRSYKLEILNDKNDTDVPEDSILATFYGIFDPPLYNKDIHTITLSEDIIREQVTLKTPKDYRWRIRLYEDEILPKIKFVATKYYLIKPDQFSDIYYDKHWTSKLTFTFDSGLIPDKIIYKLNNDDADTWQEYDSSDFIDNTVIIELPHDNNWGSIEVLTYDKNNSKWIGYQDQYKFFYYSTNIHIQTIYGNTYVGAGHTVGTTKNVIWLTKPNNYVVEDRFVQTTLYSDDDSNDFNPFYNNESQVGSFKTWYQSKDGIMDYFEIDQNDILPEYRKKIADGNMYFVADVIKNDGIAYDTNILPKRIIGFENIDDGSLNVKSVIKIDPNQAYVGDDGDIFESYEYRLVYIQRQQIYSIDNAVGTHQLTKITLDEPLDYNVFHNQSIETGLVSDDFDYNRVYIDPVKEFDSKLVPSAYINIAYTKDQLLYTNTNNLNNDNLSKYTDSLACMQLTNYVATTGECSLFTKLNFKPDRHYMYQIFIVDQQSAEYNPANSINPYKFYAGTTYNSEDNTINPCYLGGYSGNLTDNNNQTNLLPVYSNHQIGETNQFLCFIQPNLGIFEDKYKPCMLQLYNNKYQRDVYITNYNDETTVYNKDLSIDTLDDSQWLVALTYPDQITDDSVKTELVSLIEKPQTKYKIYTNFVNSIPEAYFYYRDNKVLEFEYLDFYTQKILKIKYLDDDTIKEETDLTLSEDAVKVLPRRDVCVKCRIYDSNDSKKQKNLVTIKCYKYIIAEVNKYDLNVVDDIIYESDLIYDGKFEYIIKGLNSIYDNDDKIVNNPTLYRIQIIAEDEYGYQYNFAEDIYFGYKQDIVNDRISAQVDCNKQAVHVNFAPIKTFSGVGSVSADDKVEFVSINNKDGLLFNSLQDAANNTISISEDFIFYTRLRIQDNMFDQEMEQDILVIEDDLGCQYKVTFDTRVYIRGSGAKQTIINEDYLSFRLRKLDDNGNEVVDKVVIEDIYGNTTFNKPSGFYYMIDTEDKKTTGVYMIETSEDEQSVSVNDFNIKAIFNNDGQYQVLSGTDDTDYKIYDNDGSDINASNTRKMEFLYFKISPESMEISQNNFN